MSSLVIRQSLVPMLTFYIVFMVVLAVGLRMSRSAARRDAADADPGKARSGKARSGQARSGQAEPAAQASAASQERTGRLEFLSRPGWPRLIIQYARTAVGGYVLLMAVVVIYYFGVARVGSFIESAVTGCALLIGLSAPVFLLFSWLTARRS
jgi:Family of unknown function (DUF6256)